MVSFLRQVGRVCSALIAVHVTMAGTLFLYSRLGTDRVSEAHWQYSTPALIRRTNHWRFWERSFYQRVLSTEERRCLSAWLTIMSTKSPHVGTPYLSPLILAHDSLCMLDGICEVRDGVYFLEQLLHRVTPYVAEVRHEEQEGITYLHAKVNSDVSLRVPFTSYVFTCGTFPASITLRLEPVSASSRHLMVTVAEHRWFGGPVLSRQAGTVPSLWGDIGDLCRRYNGFMLASMVTKKVSISSKVSDLKMRAAKIEARVKADQERQIRQ